LAIKPYGVLITLTLFAPEVTLIHLHLLI